MKLFECQHCGQALYFESTQCESCGHRLGYVVEAETLSALEPDGPLWRALAWPERRYRFCANSDFEVCNWLVPADQTEDFCVACRHNRTIPNLSIWGNQARWKKIEVAKHRLFYTLLRLRLPLANRYDDRDGLVFDFVASDGVFHPMQPMTTGHSNGLITINLAEADDAERERQRNEMAEPYRTLLGHFRHEIAHYYWDRLVFGTPNLEPFRRVFGDERENYSAALQRHYAQGAPADWPQRFVSAYASAHPWEDFAETWAHYLHMIDTLETANSFGLRLRPKLSKGAEMGANIDFDPHHADLARLVEAWLPLTFAVNSINRSMGMSDLYPFVVAPTVVAKLDFIHSLVHARDTNVGHQQSRNVLRAMIQTLKKKVWLPDPAA